jgi:hypothetical protein
MKRISLLAGVLVVLAVFVPGTAVASSSTCQAYNPQLCSSVGNNNTSNGSTPGSDSASNSSASTLPFTGLDVVLLVAGGGALLGAGFVVRRLSRRLN